MADPTFIAMIQWSPILHAAYEGDSAKVESLLDAKGTADETDGLGRTALIQASAQGHADVVDILLKHGAEVNFAPTMDGRTALHWAAHYKHIKCCSVLQASGADCHARDNNGATAQELAMQADADFILVSDGPPIVLDDLLVTLPEFADGPAASSDLFVSLESEGETVETQGELVASPPSENFGIRSMEEKSS